MDRDAAVRAFTKRRSRGILGHLGQLEPVRQLTSELYSEVQSKWSWGHVTALAAQRLATAHCRDERRAGRETHPDMQQ